VVRREGQLPERVTRLMVMGGTGHVEFGRLPPGPEDITYAPATPS
jgi:hypothetical protein